MDPTFKEFSDRSMAEVTSVFQCDQVLETLESIYKDVSGSATASLVEKMFLQLMSVYPELSTEYMIDSEILFADKMCQLELYIAGKTKAIRDTFETLKLKKSAAIIREEQATMTQLVRTSAEDMLTLMLSSDHQKRELENLNNILLVLILSNLKCSHHRYEHLQ